MTGSGRIVLASGNPGKLRELRQLFASTAFELIPQSQLGVTDIEETGASFAENALIKARHAAALSGCPAIADDSGLVVDALNGAPGVRSARYAGDRASDAENIGKLLSALAGVSSADRSARFVCVMAYVGAEDAEPILCEGEWRGQIADAPRGERGFGYDPVFYVAEMKCTAAEMDAATKNRLSHRGQALRALLKALTAPCELPG